MDKTTETSASPAATQKPVVNWTQAALTFDPPAEARANFFLPVTGGYETLSGSVLQLKGIKKSKEENKLIAEGHAMACAGQENPAESPRKGRQLLEVGFILGMIEVETGDVFESFPQYLESLEE